MSETAKINALGLLTIPVVVLLCYLAIPSEMLNAGANQTQTSFTAGPDPDPRPAESGRVLGKWLFRRNCSACHGPEGIGGTVNPNYIKDTYPQLNILAEKMMIVDAEDAKAVIEALEKGEDLENAELDIAKANVVVAQFKALRDVVRKGSQPGKKDVNGPDPTAMPTWANLLKDEEIYAIFSYLISLQKWEDDETGEVAKETRAEGGSKEVIVTPKPPPEELEAKLTNHDGKEFQFSDLRGDVVVVSFIYTRCSAATMCPALGKKLAEAQDRLAAAGVRGVRFLLISFDPYDKPERLKEFGVKYDVDFSNFWFAFGDQDQVGPFARTFNNFYRQRAEDKYDHNIVLGIVDRNGRICDDFFGTDWEVEELVEVLQEISAK